MMNRRSQATSLLLTLLIGGLLVLVMTQVRLDVPGRAEWPPQRVADVALVVEDDNFFEVLETPEPLPGEVQQASEALSETPQDNASTPAPTTGTDLRDAGRPAEAPAPVTSRRESPKQQTVEPQRPQGPSQAELQAQEEARRRATATTSRAFERSQGNNNTSASGATEGNSGTPQGTAGSYHGHGHGQVNGGWIVPQYRRLPSTLTGVIKVRATIRPDGTVANVTLLNGTAPAGTDAALRKAVVDEVRNRRFTRNDSNPPAEATAIITYIFE